MKPPVRMKAPNKLGRKTKLPSNTWIRKAVLRPQVCFTSQVLTLPVVTFGARPPGWVGRTVSYPFVPIIHLVWMNQLNTIKFSLNFISNEYTWVWGFTITDLVFGFYSTCSFLLNLPRTLTYCVLNLILSRTDYFDLNDLFECSFKDIKTQLKLILFAYY